jgi:hypothetical protein
MGTEYLQSNLSGGELSPQLHARVDIDKYSSSVADAKNMVIVPQGGLRRRPGLSKIEDGYYAEEVRIEPFVFNQTQKYIVVFRIGAIDILKDGVLIASNITTAYTDLSHISELDIIQSADTCIITHELYPPSALVRTTDETIWTFNPISLLIPDNDFGNGDEPVWSVARGYPSACTFYYGRLWFAGSTEKPTTVWGSRVNSYYDFTWTETLGIIPDDHAIFDTIDTNEYNKIVNLFSGRNLQVFTTASEFVNTVQFPTPANSSWQQQTGYGSVRIRPIIIDGATLYVDSSSRTIRQFIFDFNEDSFVSKNITLLASHLLTNIKSMKAIKGTSLDVSDYVYAVNEDGTIAVMNTLRSEGLLGWTHWETQGEFMDACVLSKDAYFLVKRNGGYFIEKLTEGTYTDHNVVYNTGVIETFNIVDSGMNIVDATSNIVDTTGTNGVNTLTTNFKSLFYNTYFKVIADYSIQLDAIPISDGIDLNHFDITRDAYRLEIGLDFSTRILSLPINTDLKSGNGLYKRKRVVKADISVVDSLGVYVRNIYSADRKFTALLDTYPAFYTGFKEIYLLGYDRITQIEITQEEPLPLLIRAIGFEIAY